MRRVYEKFEELYKKHNCYMILSLTLSPNDNYWNYYQEIEGHNRFKDPDKLIKYMDSIMSLSSEKRKALELERLKEEISDKKEELESLEEDLKRKFDEG